MTNKMPGGYYSEFEKWLQDSKKDSGSDEDTEDDHDALLVDEDAADNDHNKLKQSWKEKTALSSHDSAPILGDSDSAPILLDSDEEIFPHQKNQFEDEPPVLEPAPKHTGKELNRSFKKSTAKSKNQDFLKNYSRQKMSKLSSLSEKQGSLKTYSKKLEIEGDHPKLSKESGNIFDKFTTLSEHDDDSPPPLIPSPEAMHLHGDPPTPEQSQAQSSPAFIAMEADSTSELPGSGPRSRRLSKNWAPGSNDVLVECDSTCMLGGSPLIVSPAASNSEGELRDQGGGNGGIDLDPSTVNEEIALSPSQTQQSGNMSLKQRESLNDKASSKSQTNDHKPLPILEHCSIEKIVPDYNSLSSKPEPLPALEMFPCKAGISIADSKESLSPSHGGLDEPPVLCVIPLSPSPNRAKRHTIDSPETFSPSGKRPRTIPSPTHAQPPVIPHVSELESPKVGFVCKHGHHAHIPQHRKSSGLQRRRRCQSSTLPSSGNNTITACVHHLPDCLQTFTLATCALSNLQNRMHKLLHTLFPALRADLDTMAPGSVRFQTLLSDLVQSLQRDEGPADPQSSERLTSVGFADSKEMVLPSQQLSLSDNHSAAKCNPDNHANSSSETGESTTVSVSKLVSEQHNEENPDVNTPSVSENEIIPGLSCLHLSGDKPTTQHGLQPVSILLQQNVEEQLWEYSKLSCSALQLLLPDLTVSLGNELQDSCNLQVFVDNVILANSREKK